MCIRDSLKTLDIHDDTFARLAPLIPDGTLRIAESGISGPSDAARFAGEGADGILVGEALVKDGDPTAAATAMIAAGTAAQKDQR